MKILSYNPGHDGAFSYLKNGQLMFSVEAEKNSKYRYSPVSCPDLFNSLEEIDEIPDVICMGGWWPHDNFEYNNASKINVGYRGVLKNDIISDKKIILGKPIHYFSSSHERSHILCAYGMSEIPIGTPCYALVWEGAIGTFYEIDSNLNISPLAEVLSQVGNRYGLFYGIADPTFPKNGMYPRFQDAGKLMALASFSNRNTPTEEEKELLNFLLEGSYDVLSSYENLKNSKHYNVGLDDIEFRNFAGIFSDKVFDKFYQFAKKNMRKDMPLIIGGGCGLNCDWNSKWKNSGLFSDVFVSPVTNDSGSAIGTAIDAQFHYCGNPKIGWNVYSGLSFNSNCTFDVAQYDVYNGIEKAAELLASDLILAWVNEKYEIGPRALGNRSILASPFKDSTRIRLNEIKQREQFRPIAPVCLEEDALKWFGCEHPSPYMLYTYVAKTDKLAAVTHVNKTARLQTVSLRDNRNLFCLLEAFKKYTGFGVLCNTSLNFNGRGFINRIDDLSSYVITHNLDGFVVEGKCFVLKSSKVYQEFLTMKK